MRIAFGAVVPSIAIACTAAPVCPAVVVLTSTSVAVVLLSVFESARSTVKFPGVNGAANASVVVNARRQIAIARSERSKAWPAFESKAALVVVCVVG